MLSLKEYRTVIDTADDLMLDHVMFESAEDIEKIGVKNAFWKSNLGKHKQEYWFDIEGDEGSDCPDYMKAKNPDTREPALYHVGFNSADLRGVKSTSIAFYRCMAVGDAKKDLGFRVFQAIKKAIYEYIQKFKPDHLNWIPISKTSSRVQPKRLAAANPQARKNIYELMSRQNLFPDQFVSIEENGWISRKLYDEFMVPEGFPPIPRGMTSDSPSAEKTEILQSMRQFYDGPNGRSAHSRAMSKYGDAQQLAASREAVEALEDTNFNPQGVKNGDTVVFKALLAAPAGDGSGFEEELAAVSKLDWARAIDQRLLSDLSNVVTGKVVLNQTSSQPRLRPRFGNVRGETTDKESADFIFVPVNFDFGDGSHLFSYIPGANVYSIPVSKLQPVSAEQAGSLKKRMKDHAAATIESPEHNPKAFKVGDYIMISDSEFQTTDGVNNNAGTYQVGSVGRIQSLELKLWRHGTRGDKSSPLTEVFAKVSWDKDRSLVDGDISKNSHEISVQHPMAQPYNEVNKNRFLASKERAENLAAAGTGLRRHERALERDRERLAIAARATNPETQELINDPRNPERIKPGDVIRLATDDEMRAWLSQGNVLAHLVIPAHRGKTAVVHNLLKKPVFHGDDPFELVVEYRLVGGRSSTSNGSANIAFAHKADERGQVLHQRAMARAQARTNISDATGGRQIGDRVTVATGRQRGLTGTIVGWRQTGGYTYAKVRTDGTDSSPSEEVQINVRLLEPVPGVPANEQNNPYSFENFLLARLGL